MLSIHQSIIFLVFLAAPVVIIRTVFWLTAKPISSIHKQTLNGYKFHHLHYGLIVAFIGCLALFYTLYTSYAVAIIGFGLGLSADEFVATLLIPEEEPQDTLIYKSTLKQTLYLLAGLILVVAIFILLRQG